MFGKLFGMSSGKTRASSPAKLSSAISNSIISVVGNKSIPPMPGAAQKAFQLATDPGAEARDFIEVIESDEALSARVIKIANSVFFDRGKASQTIEESVLVIGINELRCLLNATTLSDIFPSKHPARAQLWANDVATSLIARILAQRLLPSKAEAAFLGGLMHDIGKLLLLQRASDEYTKVLKNVASTGTEFFKAEEEVFLFNHCEAGQLIAERWNFSSELTGVIRDHHLPWSSLKKDGSVSLAGIIKAADTFAHAAGLGHPGGFTTFRNRNLNLADECFDNLGIAPGERKDLLAGFQKTFELEFDLYSGKASK